MSFILKFSLQATGTVSPQHRLPIFSTEIIEIFRVRSKTIEIIWNLEQNLQEIGIF